MYLGIDLIQQAGERDGLPDMLQSADEARIIHEHRSEAVEAEARRRLLASEDDAGVPTAVLRGGRARKAPPGERIGRRSRCS